MSDLATTFMGLELRNPIVVGASHLTASIRKIRACEKAGAGAVVLKSIFEAKVESESRGIISGMRSPSSSDGHAVLKELGQNLALDEYLSLIERAKKGSTIPVIASIHCVTGRGWEEYASRIEAVGADALQLNLFELDAGGGKNGGQIERSYLDVVKRLRRKVKIPIAAKLGPQLSSPRDMAFALREAGVDGLVLFNRFYGPDVDIDRMRLTGAPVLSDRSEALPALRWIGILSGQLDADFAASGGIHTARGVLKQLLVGARVVEMCTAFYTDGLEQIGRMTAEIEGWMKRHKFSTLSDFRGSLCQDRAKDPATYEMTQYYELHTTRSR